MLNIEVKIENKHEGFKGKISDELYNNLKKLYNLIIEGGENESFSDKSDMLNIIPVEEKMQSEDKKMKRHIFYIKWCKLIKSLLEEYPNGSENEKEIIEYYIKSNTLQEMNSLGLGYYYDVKYKYHTATLYSVGYGQDSNWSEWLQNNDKEEIKENKIKENGIQLIFKACKEHINRGGNVRLKSLSKCLGVDLFKYMKLDEKGKANLYIIKDAPINFIEINDKKFSLQEYLVSDEVFDINCKPQFCIDFSYPRNEKIENYNTWSKKFLNCEYISQAEIEAKKKLWGLEQSNNCEYIILAELIREHTKHGEKAISSRISPIVDKEVIVSDNLWRTREYTSDLKIDDTNSENVCYHFSFDKKEYCQLIFYYFKEYSNRKLKQKSERKYEDEIKGELDNANKILTKLEREKNNLEELKLINESNEKQIQEENRDIEQKVLLINFYKEYIKFLNSIYVSEEVPKKIKLVLQFIDWKTEEIPKKWNLNNIYASKDWGEENLLINLYKCICKSAILREKECEK